MKYDERTCKVNMDTGCVELRLRDGRMISIDIPPFQQLGGENAAAELLDLPPFCAR